MAFKVLAVREKTFAPKLTPKQKIFYVPKVGLAGKKLSANISSGETLQTGKVCMIVKIIFNVPSPGMPSVFRTAIFFLLFRENMIQWFRDCEFGKNRCVKRFD